MGGKHSGSDSAPFLMSFLISTKNVYSEPLNLLLGTSVIIANDTPKVPGQFRAKKCFFTILNFSGDRSLSSCVGRRSSSCTRRRSSSCTRGRSSSLYKKKIFFLYSKKILFLYKKRIFLNKIWFDLIPQDPSPILSLSVVG